MFTLSRFTRACLRGIKARPTWRGGPTDDQHQRTDPPIWTRWAKNVTDLRAIHNWIYCGDLPDCRGRPQLNPKLSQRQSLI
jgi:hypothetical protein